MPCIKKKPCSVIDGIIERTLSIHCDKLKKRTKMKNKRQSTKQKQNFTEESFLKTGWDVHGRYFLLTFHLKGCQTYEKYWFSRHTPICLPVVFWWGSWYVSPEIWWLPIMLLGNVLTGEGVLGAGMCDCPWLYFSGSRRSMGVQLKAMGYSSWEECNNPVCRYMAPPRPISLASVC